MKIIAHGIKNALDAKKALKAGVDFLEIDVSKRLIFNKFTIQHNGLMGIFGIGPILDKILTAEIKTRAFLDLKPVSFRNSFSHKLANLLIKLKVKDAKICGHSWQLISTLCEKTNSKPFYTIKNKEAVYKLKKMLKDLRPPAGFSVKYDLIDKKFIKEFRKKSVQIWAWTVNDLEEAKRLAILGVDGIITDEWRLLRSLPASNLKP